MKLTSKDANALIGSLCIVLPSWRKSEKPGKVTCFMLTALSVSAHRDALVQTVHSAGKRKEAQR